MLQSLSQRPTRGEGTINWLKTRSVDVTWELISGETTRDHEGHSILKVLLYTRTKKSEAECAG